MIPYIHTLSLQDESYAMSPVVASEAGEIELHKNTRKVSRAPFVNQIFYVCISVGLEKDTEEFSTMSGICFGALHIKQCSN